MMRRLEFRVLAPIWFVLGAVALLTCSLCAHAAYVVGSPFTAPVPPDVTLEPGAFLVSISVTGASDLQQFQFDLTYDKNVVKVVPVGFSLGIFGAEFVPGDMFTQSFIFSGFNDSTIGFIDDIAGGYIFGSVNGDGVVAYVEFQYLDPGSTADPGIVVGEALTPPATVPEPGTLALSALGGFALWRARRASTFS